MNRADRGRSQRAARRKDGKQREGFTARQGKALVVYRSGRVKKAEAESSP